MGWFMAKLYDRSMAEAERACLRSWRAALLAEASGVTLDIGAGTGANIEHFSDAVTRLVLAEPDRHMRAKLQARLSGRDAELITSSAENIELPNASCDTVSCMLVLCSVSDPSASLRELHRVLKPGGKLLFIEHVAAHDRPDRLRWQRRIEPIWKLVAAGCHLTRDTAQAIEENGFEMQQIDRASIRKAMPLVRPSVRGIAIRR